MNLSYLFRLFIINSLILISCTISSAQFPNGGFEDWEMEDYYGYSIPVFTDWEIYYKNTVVPDTNAIKGNYCLKLNRQGSYWKPTPVLWQSIVLDEPIEEGNSVYYSRKLKIERGDDVYLYVALNFFTIDSVFLGNGVNLDTIDIDNWEELELSQVPANTQFITIEIASRGANNSGIDLLSHELTSWVDHIHIRESSLVDNEEVANISNCTFYPNPSRGEINIDCLLKEDDEIQFYDISGKFISKVSSNDAIYIDLPGTYFVNIIGTNGTRTLSKPIIVIN